MEITRDPTNLWVVNSNNALEFKLVRHPEDMNDDSTTFKPEMSHQVFENEGIFGYQDLRVKLYYTAGHLNTYVEVEFKAKVDPINFNEIGPDDIFKILAKKMPPGFLTNSDAFLDSLNKESKFVPHGKLIWSFQTKRDGQASRTYEIYFCDTSDTEFIKYHERLQTFILWYIDASSFIDVDDENWKFFVCYERYKLEGKQMYAIAGYATVYQYYAYPKNIRPRISQFLILPPFQRHGIGANLLRTICNYYKCIDEVLDITVEDPSEEFQYLRDYVDCENLMSLPTYKPNVLKEGFSEAMVKDARTKFKVNKKQARRVYEILRLKATNRRDLEDYKQYRLNVKKRLNSPYQKEQVMLEKMQKVLSEEELKTATANLKDKSQRLESLDRQYRELEEEYQHVIERLASS